MKSEEELGRFHAQKRVEIANHRLLFDEQQQKERRFDQRRNRVPPKRAQVVEECELR